MGQLTPGSVFYVDRPAGEYYIDGISSLWLPVKISAKAFALSAGQTTYIKLSISAWGFDLDLVSPEVATSEMARTQYTGAFDAIAVKSHAKAATAARERYTNYAQSAGIRPGSADRGEDTTIHALSGDQRRAPTLARTGGLFALGQSPSTGGSPVSLFSQRPQRESGRSDLVVAAESPEESVEDPAGSSGPSGGLYQVEPGISFNVLDRVYYDAASGQIALLGHNDSRYQTRGIPYLQYLATFLECPQPEFSLQWTPGSARRVDALLAGELTQQGSDAQAARFGAIVDQAGNINRMGTLMLPALGINPIADGKAPGDLGVEVGSAGNGQVAVMKIRPGSAAERAGLRLIDFIYSVRPDRAAFYKSEFERQVRFAGAGSFVRVTYYRQPDWKHALAQLDAASDADPWRGVNRYDLIGLLYRQQGDVAAARVIETMGIMSSMLAEHEPYAGLSVYSALMDALGMEADFKRLQAAGGQVPYELSHNFGLRVSQQLDSLFHLAGSPMQANYTSAVQRTGNPATALSGVLDALGGQMVPKVGEMIDRLIYRPGVGFQIPPELVEEEYHIHPVMTPQYLGVPADSQLARLMLAGDYLCKQLTNRQDLKGRIAGYQTQVEYQINHPEAERGSASAYRVWTSIAGVDVAQSADGKTLAINAARMRFSLRQTDSRGADLPNQRPDGYADVLNGLYDSFAQQFPVLQEEREAAKLAAVAAWMLKQNPNARLPTEGRATWRGPGKVKGLVYLYLTQNLQRESKIIKIAEGGLSFNLQRSDTDPLRFPVDPKVVDLRGSHVYATLFSQPPGASPDATGRVTPVPDDAPGLQAVVVQARQLAEKFAHRDGPAAVPQERKAAGDSAFGTPTAHPTLLPVDREAGRVGTDTSANHQLNALGKTAPVPGASARPGEIADETASSNARNGFDSGNRAAGAIDASQVKPPSEPEEIQIPERMINDKDLAADMLKLNVYKQQAKQSHAAAAAAQEKFEAERKANPQSPQLPVLLEQAREAKDKAGGLDNFVKVKTGEIKRRIDTTVDAAPALPGPAPQPPAPGK